MKRSVYSLKYKINIAETKWSGLAEQLANNFDIKLCFYVKRLDGIDSK